MFFFVSILKNSCEINDNVVLEKSYFFYDLSTFMNFMCSKNNQKLNIFNTYPHTFFYVTIKIKILPYGNSNYYIRIASSKNRAPFFLLFQSSQFKIAKNYNSGV